MSDVPFGFGGPGDEGDDDKPADRQPGQPADPFAAMGGGDMRQAAEMLRRFADMLSNQGGGGPLNWDLAKDIARHAVVEQGDPSIVDAERRQVEEALRLADLWLDDATTIPAGIHTPKAWSRSEWIEQTLPVWAKLCDPVAARMVESMNEAMPQEMQAMAGPLIGMVRQMAGAMVGGQAGQALGALAKDVVGSADVGLPLAPEGVGALLPAGVAAFGAGLEVPDEEVRLYLALREAAHQRLFVHVPWLRAYLLGAVEDYARGIKVDLSGLEEAVSGLDVANPEALQEALSGGLLPKPEDSPQQKAALARLETALALVEGWVDTAVGSVAEGRLPGSAKLAEAVRRRRATGGPAEATFATLVGLQLRPRRLREAAALWRALDAARGIEGRDAVWAHPDLLPTSDDLDDPDAFVHGKQDDFDISQLTESPRPAADDSSPDDSPAGPQDDSPDDAPGDDSPPPNDDSPPHS
jgi:putative hydrolase